MLIKCRRCNNARQLSAIYENLTPPNNVRASGWWFSTAYLVSTSPHMSPEKLPSDSWRLWTSKMWKTINKRSESLRNTHKRRFGLCSRDPSHQIERTLVRRWGCREDAGHDQRFHQNHLKNGIRKDNWSDKWSLPVGCWQERIYWRMSSLGISSNEERSAIDVRPQ